ncbi:MAG: DUF255 domain-containing protein [Woeseiaceae bacterium]
MKIIIIVCSVFITFLAQAAVMQNVLKEHASPYLALHGSDPVKWQEWNKETLARAKKEDKLLYVSSGYFACHWCHVMQRESYKNPEVAQILNKYFIPIKVDREINSALDSHLIDFVERTQGRAGWPLNVFITPEGYPLVGMTYVPTKNFISILTNIKKKWKDEKVELKEIAKSAANELSNNEPTTTEKITDDDINEYIQSFLVSAEAQRDTMSGGFGEQNKFPSVPQLSLMVSIFKKQPNEDLKQFLLLTLNKMATQGLNDQLAGGFFRYTVDPVWQVPHFEKMLYDNALLASLYMKAATVFHNDQFDVTAKQTLDFLIKDFNSKQGAFIASLSALDNKGVEGGYYTWNKKDFVNVLTEQELKLVQLMWQLEGNPELDSGHHLVEVMPISEAAKILNISFSQAQENFYSAKKKLIKIRSTRIIPKDTKLLTAWNGLALSAFSQAAKKYNKPRYAEAAHNILMYIQKSLWIENRLVRTVNKKKILGEASLEDYAYVAKGVLDYLDYKKNKHDLIWLEQMINQAWKRFYINDGWRLSDKSLLKYGANEVVVSDGVLPSSSAVLIDSSLRLNKLKSNKLIEGKAINALHKGKADILRQPFWYASHIQVFLNDF